MIRLLRHLLVSLAAGAGTFAVIFGSFLAYELHLASEVAPHDGQAGTGAFLYGLPTAAIFAGLAISWVWIREREKEN